MATIVSNSLLINGLRTEFVDTYQSIKNRQADSRLGLVMDLTVQATNRNHDFAYLNAAPHFEQWKLGETVPTDAMDSVQFNVPVYNWARRVPWSKWDRADDQTGSLFDMARMAGESAALVPERIFFGLLSDDATDLLPAIPNAPDGVGFFSTATRFEATGGNVVTKDGVTTTQMIQKNYYEVLQRFMAFKDGKGQPLLSKETIDAGVIIIHAAASTEAFETAFMQQRQGIGLDTTGGRTSVATITAATAESNLVLDSSRNVQLWGTSRLTTADEWYVFLRNPPKQATFLLDRQSAQEFSALEGDNNSDSVRDRGEEYIQFESRSGGGIALPYGAIQVA
jgi:hypothetical protein